MLVGAEAIIDEARNGRMFILVDDDDRENEGDLVIPAQMATPDAINFMARHGRGLICLALAKERVDQLGLEPMARINRTRMETAFTVSIEAREGVTTGISAADRARTIAVAIDAANGPDAIVSPGHVFPLVARPGGVLVRAGHTEAAVDVARLAGLNPSGVICEIMREDGTMARLDDLMEFAARPRPQDRHDPRPHRLSAEEGPYGRAGRRDALHRRVAAPTGPRRCSATRPAARSSWRWSTARSTRPSRRWCGCTRIDLFADVLGEQSERAGLLHGAMAMIEAEGAGVIVALHAAAPGSLSRSRPTFARARPARRGTALRGYGIGAQILAALGIHDMILLSQHPPCAGRAVAPMAWRSSKSAASRAGENELGPYPDRRGALLRASQRHAARRRARRDRGGRPQP